MKDSRKRNYGKRRTGGSKTVTQRAADRALCRQYIKIEVAQQKRFLCLKGTADYIKHLLRDYFDRVNISYSLTASLRELITCLERTDNCKVAVSFI